MRKIKVVNRKKAKAPVVKCSSKKRKSPSGSKHDKLDKLREQILTTSWHPLQTESYVKQLFVELIDALKERP